MEMPRCRLLKGCTALGLWVNLSWLVQLRDTGLQSHPALSFGWHCIPSGDAGLRSFCCGPATGTCYGARVPPRLGGGDTAAPRNA